MINKLHYIIYSSILIIIIGCNGDIFIDDYLPGEPDEIIISETDNGKEINFKSDNWSLIKVFCEMSYPFTINAYNLNGELTYLPFDEKEPGTVHYTSDYIDVRIEKKSGKKLKITLNENLLDEDVKMLLIVGNDFKQKQINLVLAPTQKYQIDRVVYDWNKFEVHKGGLIEVQSLTVDNQKNDTPLTIGFFPFMNSNREVDFYDPTVPHFDNVYSKLLGNPLPEIIIPDIVDGGLVLLDTKVELDVGTQHLPTGLDKKLVVDVTIDPFDIRKVIVYNEFISYSVPYKIYLSNPKIGKELTFSGKLNSGEPIDYLIFKRRVDEN